MTAAKQRAESTEPIEIVGCDGDTGQMAVAREGDFGPAKPDRVRHFAVTPVAEPIGSATHFSVPFGLVSEPSSVEVSDFTTGRVFRFLDGSERRVATVGPSWVGRGVYNPGWRWSRHVQPLVGQPAEEHLGYVVSGEMAVRGSDGHEAVVRPGEAWFAARGHDAWVIGDEPCVALDFPLQ